MPRKETDNEKPLVLNQGDGAKASESVLAPKRRRLPRWRRLLIEAAHNSDLLDEVQEAGKRF